MRNPLYKSPEIALINAGKCSAQIGDTAAADQYFRRALVMKPGNPIAAYNLGMGHMNGARRIAEGMKKDPDSWYEMKTVLPLLARPEYYERLKSGRARGGEAVITAENVRMYYDILSRYEPPYRPFAESQKNSPANAQAERNSSPPK